MSMSTPHRGGNTSRSASTKPGGKPKDSAAAGAAQKKAGAPARSAGPARSGTSAKKPPGKKSGGPRKPITPIKVNQGRNWGPIALFALVGVIALGIIGFGAFQVFQNSKTWEDRAAEISGIKNYRKDDPKLLEYQQH